MPKWSMSLRVSGMMRSGFDMLKRASELRCEFLLCMDERLHLTLKISIPVIHSPKPQTPKPVTYTLKPRKMQTRTTFEQISNHELMQFV